MVVVVIPIIRLDVFGVEFECLCFFVRISVRGDPSYVGQIEYDVLQSPIAYPCSSSFILA
jgi:hypothetical protein